MQAPRYFKVRLPLPLNADPSEAGADNIITNARPAVYNGNDLLFELGFTDPTGETIFTDVSTIESVKVQVKETLSESAPALMSATVTPTNINQSLEQADWDARTDQHLAVHFTKANSKLNLGGEESKEFWLIISYTTPDNPDHCVTAYRREILFVEDGEGDGEGYLQPPSLIPPGSTYDGSGNFTLGSLTFDKVYLWEQAANDLTIVSGSLTLTETGVFTAQNAVSTLTGQPNQPVTAAVRADVTLTVDQMDARYLRRPVGAWQTATLYAVDRLVTHDGRLFIAKTEHSSVEPPAFPATESDDWLLLIERGVSAYVYLAYADDDQGAGFTTTFDAAKDYIAIKTTTVEIATPAVGDFAGLWKNYKGPAGQNGTNGTNGTDGNDGASSFTYIAYADDDQGAGFTTTFDAAKDYIAIKTTAAEIATPSVGDFAGLWKNYKGATGTQGPPGSGSFPAGVTIDAGTSRTLAVADLRRVIEFTHDDPSTLEIPESAASLIFVGEAVMVRQSGAGVVTAAPASGSGVTIIGDKQTEHVGDILFLYQGETNIWRGTLIRRSKQTFASHTFTEQDYYEVLPEMAWGNHALKLDLQPDEYGNTYIADVHLRHSDPSDASVKPSKGDLIFVNLSMPLGYGYAVDFYDDSDQGTKIDAATVRSIPHVTGEWFLVFAWSGATWYLFTKAPVPGTFYQEVFLPAGSFKPTQSSTASEVVVTFGTNEFDAIRMPDGSNLAMARTLSMLPPNFRPNDRIKFAHWWTAKDSTGGEARLFLWLNAREPGASLTADGPPANTSTGTSVLTQSAWTNAVHLMRAEGEWLHNATWNTFNNHERLLQVYIGIEGDHDDHDLGANTDHIGLELFIPVEPTSVI